MDKWRLPLFAIFAFSLLSAQQKPLTSTQMKKQIELLISERDDLQSKLTQYEESRDALTSAQKSLELLKNENEDLRMKLDQMKNTLSENDQGSETMLKEFADNKKELELLRNKVAQLEKENDDLNPYSKTGIKEGSLVVLSEEITPAKPMNLDRVNPRLGPSWGRPRGMVIVNVLINERGEVLAARILQGLAGESSETKDADEACLESAKRVVFDPARSNEGRRVKVWQAVGFYLD